jgi:DNA-binding transcriptional regulator YhcF (GntR family)
VTSCPRSGTWSPSLAINPNTVLKAYKELETKGLALGRPGQGTFIQATLSQVALPELTGLRKLPARLVGRRRRGGA